MAHQYEGVGTLEHLSWPFLWHPTTCQKVRPRYEVQPEDWGTGTGNWIPRGWPKNWEPLGTTWNHAFTSFHSFHWPIIRLPDIVLDSLHQDSVILLADDDDAVPCENSAKAGKTCLFTCVYVYIISYYYICVYVVINNRHRYITWQYVVCKGTAHIGTCVPTYKHMIACVCVCAYTNSYRCKHIYM